MLSIFYSIFLGAIQGITEFLPISSSGHLVIFRDFLGINVKYGLAFDAVLQLATALAVLVYFRRDLWGILKSMLSFSIFKSSKGESDIQNRKLLVWLVIATIPAIIFGLSLQDFMESTFRSTIVVSIGLIVGSVVMYFADSLISNDRLEKSSNHSWFKAVIIGLFQSLALVPGMSRSGMTISGGYFMGLSKEFAIKFSFLLSIPIIIGSGVVKLEELVANTELINQIGLELLMGSVSAFVFGFFAIDFMIKFLRNNTFKWFIVYRIALAILLIILAM